MGLLLIVCVLDFKICLWVTAYRALLGCIGSDKFMSAVSALPSLFAFACEDLIFLQIFKQSQIPCFVMLFDFSDFFEQERNIVKAFFFCFGGKAFVHVAVFKVFALCRFRKVICCGRYFIIVKQFEPYFGVLFFVICALQKKVRDLFVSFFSCFARKIRVFVACHGLASKCFVQVFFRLCAF